MRTKRKESIERPEEILSSNIESRSAAIGGSFGQRMFGRHRTNYLHPLNTLKQINDK